MRADESKSRTNGRRATRARVAAKVGASAKRGSDAFSVMNATDGEVAVINSIRRIVRGLRLSARDAERRFGVTGAQLFVLQQIGAAPVESLNDIAGRTLTHQSTVSVVVQRLVARGFVARTPSSRDGRRVTVSLTPEGRALARRAPDVAQVRMVNALKRLPKRDVRTLAHALEKLVREMGMAEEPPEMFFAEKGR
jgi:DNA-binding MarR family transcriptional regulator